MVPLRRKKIDVEFYPEEEGGEGGSDSGKRVAKMYDVMVPVGGMRVKAYSRQEEEKRNRM